MPTATEIRSYPNCCVHFIRSHTTTPRFGKQKDAHRRFCRRLRWSHGRGIAGRFCRRFRWSHCRGIARQFGWSSRIRRGLKLRRHLHIIRREYRTVRIIRHSSIYSPSNYVLTISPPHIASAAVAAKIKRRRRFITPRLCRGSLIRSSSSNTKGGTRGNEGNNDAALRSYAEE